MRNTMASNMESGKILILGARGTLGGQLLKVFGNNAVGWDRQDVDAGDFLELKSKILALDFVPSVIVNCVAYNDVDGAEKNRELALLLNFRLAENLAKISKELGSILVHFSTNYVFDGQKSEYAESDEPHPLSAYAESKLRGEKAVIEIGEKYYLVRTAVLFGPKGLSTKSKKSFVDLMLELAQKNDTIKAVSDEVNSLTYSADLAKQVKLIIDQEAPFGIYHVTNSGQASWYEFAKEIFAIKNSKVTVLPVSSAEFQRPALRPKKAVLKNTKLPTLRSWQEALSEYLESLI